MRCLTIRTTLPRICRRWPVRPQGRGGQVYIDGFSSGRFPPKESIREIRINQNPFSSEYDKLGFGRIEILTKPGSDRFHGTAFYTLSDGVWNSRNPFLTVTPDFRMQNFGGNVSGPVKSTPAFLSIWSAGRSTTTGF